MRKVREDSSSRLAELSLTSQEVVCLPAGPNLPSFLVNGPEVVDIKILPKPVPPAVDEPAKVHKDPAILNYGDPRTAPEPKRPAVDRKVPPSIDPTAPNQSYSSIITEVHHPRASDATDSQDPEATPTATLTRPFNDFDLASPPVLGLGKAAPRERPKSTQQQVNGPTTREAPPSYKRRKGKRVTRRNEPSDKSLRRPGLSPVQPLQLSGQAPPRKEEQTHNAEGWRKTPILEEVSPMSDCHSPETKNAAKSSDRCHLHPPSKPQHPPRSERRRNRDHPSSGWATADATDAQDLPEFDFAHNLSKFNKRDVFDKLKQEDTTADEDRLVYNNRLPRKLRHDENVLNGHTDRMNAAPVDGATSEGWVAGESELSLDEAYKRKLRCGAKGTSSGGDASSQRNGQRVLVEIQQDPSIRQLQQRTEVDSADQPLAGAPSIFNPAFEAKEARILTGRANSKSSPAKESQSGSVRSNRAASVHTKVTTEASQRSSGPSIERPLRASIKASNTPSNSQHTFYFSNNRPLYKKYWKAEEMEDKECPPKLCPTLTALQAFELENIAISEFGLTEDILTENASRSIAEAVFKAVTADEYSGVSVVFLAGNHRIGARAIAAGRQLVNRGDITVYLYILGLADNRHNLLECVLTQLEAFEACIESASTRHVFDLSELEDSQSVHLDHQNGIDAHGRQNVPPPWRHEQVVAHVDAILGVHRTRADLSSKEKTAYKGAMRQISSEQCRSHSISDYITIDNFSPTSIMLRHAGPWQYVNVIALTAPKPDLVATLQLEMQYPSNEDYNRLPRHSRTKARIKSRVYVADIGIPKQAWAKLGVSKLKDGISWGPAWVREVELRSPEGEILTWKRPTQDSTHGDNTHAPEETQKPGS